jgi:hypothetical protein
LNPSRLSWDYPNCRFDSSFYGLKVLTKHVFFARRFNIFLGEKSLKQSIFGIFGHFLKLHNSFILQVFTFLFLQYISASFAVFLFNYFIRKSRFKNKKDKEAFFTLSLSFLSLFF